MKTWFAALPALHAFRWMTKIAGSASELSAILGFVEQLSEVDTTDVKPYTSPVEMQIKARADAVTDGGYPEDILANAPEKDDGYFAVPKVVE